jgi:hypothetical protein
MSDLEENRYQKEVGVYMIDDAKSWLEEWRSKLFKNTGRALGDETMDPKIQIHELKGHLDDLGQKVLKSSGKALGDENLSAQEQIAELKIHAKKSGEWLRSTLNKKS